MRKVFILILTTLILASCTPNGYRIFTERKTTSFTPNEVRLNIELDDFEYLGKSEISVIYREYLGGLIQRIDSVNNEQYNWRDVKFVELAGISDIKLKAEMKKAAYKVIDDYPDADYYVIGNDYKKVHYISGGRKTWRTMEIQAFKYKQ